ncbi:chemotaxis protein CheD [Phytopseudomonas seleniipraecipitans]|uniref:Probable chemoreceptor glutamine deamidase CheD n=1 Tax=Phytopseudomonas seleniipraecipitans TaxID=640205 RepID=A0A1G7PEZ1_9GAMM|nr:chemotaxis protein CheD [Pseudomonas seleniipraecipitans]NQD79796.1 chemotaxis protein CheD [Pseudomonas sp. CrR14]SDF84876.1 chemotaxis protein CheD [Pseudomonas seleniipraecipitans]
MTKTPSIAEVYLQPGDYHFGGPYTRVRTLLGSCVSMVLWHPHARLGGMCHFMLPTRGRPTAHPDGRYGDEVMNLLCEAIGLSGTRVSEYQARIFGGGHMFPTLMNSNRRHVGLQNIDMARRLIAEKKLSCHGEHVGGIGHRNLIFDIWNGHLALKQTAPTPISGRPSGERSA